MFEPMPKIPRLNRECFVTEKIDGTNASIHIIDSVEELRARSEVAPVAANGTLQMFAGSRTRYLSPGSKETDNFGFAAWVQENQDALWSLGPGRHYGEWWGSGIQRGYGMKDGVRRFSLFNVGRWVKAGIPTWASIGAVTQTESNAEGRQFVPPCCDVVPLLYKGLFRSSEVDDAMAMLRVEGSMAAPGYDSPEGVVVYHVAGGHTYKATLKDDETPKRRGVAETPERTVRHSTMEYMQVLGLVK